MTSRPGSPSAPISGQTGAHIAEVETGAVALTRYTAVDDCSVVLNPLPAEGQIHGGIVQGIGQVLMENIIYDESGQLLSGSFQDYCMPRAADFCFVELGKNESPSDRNPLGVKGVGKAGTLGAIPAVMNAVNDALARIGAPAIEMPATRRKGVACDPDDERYLRHYTLTACVAEYDLDGNFSRARWFIHCSHSLTPT